MRQACLRLLQKHGCHGSAFCQNVVEALLRFRRDIAAQPAMTQVCVDQHRPRTLMSKHGRKVLADRRLAFRRKYGSESDNLALPVAQREIHCNLGATQGFRERRQDVVGCIPHHLRACDQARTTRYRRNQRQLLRRHFRHHANAVESEQIPDLRGRTKTEIAQFAPTAVCRAADQTQNRTQNHGKRQFRRRCQRRHHRGRNHPRLGYGERLFLQ